jgi:hypothetical protein
MSRTNTSATSLNTIETILLGSASWDITTCGTLKANRRFGGTRDLNLDGQRISLTGNKIDAEPFLLPASRWFLR